jgi:glyoxylase-like metal-dependent hydrolase (beta-lactamase superfamily II)
MKAHIYAARREYQWQQESFRSDRDITFEWMDRERYFFGDSGMYETTPIEPGQTEIEIGGAVFAVEDLSGHSPAHLGFATPDGVLHIGDAFMSDRVLRHSKIPYEYNIGKTLDSLERMKKMDYPYFAAAHKAVISAGDVGDVLDANISYHKRMLDEILQRLNGWQRTDRFIQEVIANRGVDIRRSSSSGWLPDAIRSYIDYLINEGKVETRHGLMTGAGEPAFPGEPYIKRAL